MKCEQCPYLQSLDAKVAESCERLQRNDELMARIVVAEAEDMVLIEVISQLPESPEKDTAKVSMQFAIDLSSETGDVLNRQPGLEAVFLDNLDKFRDFALSQCVHGPRIKTKLFGGEKNVCTSQSGVVDKQFKH